MGCCQSSAKGNAIEKLKDDDETKALKGDAQPRPASSTMMKHHDHDSPRLELATPDGAMDRKQSGKKKRGKPSGLSLGGQKQLRDPNMIVTTPMNGDNIVHDAFPTNNDQHIRPINKDRHEEDLNRLAMFIPWEKPALGSKGKKKKKKGPKRMGTTGRIPGGHKKSKQQVFIPGSGNEKILMADRSKTLTATKLPPLQFKKVEGNASLKKSIAADRKKAQNRRKSISSMNKYLKKEIGFDDKITKLIRQYADISKKTEPQIHMLDEAVKTNIGSNHTRTVISCPVKIPEGQ